MKPLFRRFPELIARTSALDTVARPLSKAGGRLVPPGRAKDTLAGTWLGEPLHPPLTDVVIGSWTAALAFDLRGGSDKSAERLVGLGVLAALPTAAAGFVDWIDLWGRQRRVGLVHASGNLVATSLFAASYLARRRDRQGRGRILGGLGYAVATAAAHLGGHLSFGCGIGVNQTAFDERPEEWRRVADAADVVEGEPVGIDVDGVRVLLVRQGGHVHALLDRCSHYGCWLHEGKVGDGTITCACHGSIFRLADGGVLRGPARAGQPALDVRERAGALEVRARRHPVTSMTREAAPVAVAGSASR